MAPTWPRAALPTLVAVVAIGVPLGCGGASSGSPVQVGASAVASAQRPGSSRVAVIVMENEEYGSVVGSRSAPFINRLAGRYAVARAMYAIGHPSLPNYLALTGGSTFGIHSDCTSCSVDATSLVDQLQSSHISWRAYMEDLPHPCFTGASSGAYAKKHDPFAYYTRITRDPARCGRIVPLSQLAADERAGALPRYIWITPNLCNDMHWQAGCPGSNATRVQSGDTWLSQLLPQVFASADYQAGRTLVLLTWDEGNESSTSGIDCTTQANIDSTGCHVGLIAASAYITPGTRDATRYTPYSTLAAIETMEGLPLLGRAGTATPLGHAMGF
jgi:hypothetical protein